MNIFTLKEINDIVEALEWDACTSHNEKNGEETIGIDTIQVSSKFDDEYFGEFVGDYNEDKYEFILYKL